ARLSPSILREFLTYSVVGVREDASGLDRRAERLQEHIRGVSDRKLALAKRIIDDITAPFAPGSGVETRFCVVVAGDIVYGMAHDVHRPERSTGTMVHGSDLDIVVLVADEAPQELVTQLDDAIYKKKYQYLKNPAFREEIDYVVKRFSKLAEQAEFDTLKRMIACKIFDEAVLLYGNAALFDAGKILLADRRVTDRLRAMEQAAIEAREQQEQYLLATDAHTLRGDDLHLFHTDDESEEFE
ncbi:MAG: nucleotidyltransferase domain-containing protein, partial [Micromonosporaceae bacterium]|nr:nucleotidyltransferase domain-containing protein [Micromonosporaceae bacterium]